MKSSDNIYFGNRGITTAGDTHYTTDYWSTIDGVETIVVPARIGQLKLTGNDCNNKWLRFTSDSADYKGTVTFVIGDQISGSTHNYTELTFSVGGGLDLMVMASVKPGDTIATSTGREIEWWFYGTHNITYNAVSGFTVSEAPTGAKRWYINGYQIMPNMAINWYLVDLKTCPMTYALNSTTPASYNGPYQTFFAPTSGGSKAQVLTSNGPNSAPQWRDVNTLTRYALSASSTTTITMPYVNDTGGHYVIHIWTGHTDGSLSPLFSTTGVAVIGSTTNRVSGFDIMVSMINGSGASQAMAYKVGTSPAVTMEAYCKQFNPGTESLVVSAALSGGLVFVQTTYVRPL